jgi:glutamate-ammonia-ligase adenylyltransferase
MDLHTRIVSALKAKRWKTLEPLLRDMRFTNSERALTDLRRLHRQRRLREAIPKLLMCCADSPDPNMALHGFETVASSPASILGSLLGDDRALAPLATGFALSPYFTTLLARYPSSLEWLFRQGGIEVRREREDFLAALMAFATPIQDLADLCAKLRAFKHREVLRIGLRDLSGMAGFEEVARNLSDLAGACLELACRFCHGVLVGEDGRTPVRDRGRGAGALDGVPDGVPDFVIIGMGKLGGRELNFSSDIDLQYVHASDEGEDSPGPAAEHLGGIAPETLFVRLAELITHAMGEVTEDGLVFRTDLRLRPHGTSGRITNSLRGAELYYESWGDTWERAALIKARAVAGDLALGDRFLKRVEPFVYRKHLDFTAIEEIHRLKARVEQERAAVGGKWNLKYMAGGIREIEFFLQALQLIYGGKFPILRQSNALRTLEGLERVGLLRAGDHQVLRDAYTTWRTLEHRVQMVHNEQTHALPEAPEDLARLGRAMGHAGPHPGESLCAELARRASAVREITQRLFSRPSVTVPGEMGDLLELLGDEEAKERVVEALERWGFRAPERAYTSLLAMSQGPSLTRLPEQALRRLRRLAPAMLSEALASPSPEQALTHLEQFLERVGARTSFYALLDENPRILKFLLRLFGTSFYLSSFFIQHPELLDAFVLAEASSPRRTRDLMAQELLQELRALPSFEEKLDALRRYHHTELLRIGLNDLYGALDLHAVSDQLTGLAEACLEAAWIIAREELRPRCGIPMTGGRGRRQREARMAILGLGALGAREMTYHADLDLIFIYDGPGETTRGLSNHDYFVRLAQTLMAVLNSPTREGHAYQVDTRLRPSGRFGPLVTSKEAFQAYHAEHAQTWERQTITRSRCVAGEERLARQVQEMRRRIISGRPFTEDMISEIHHHRERMQHELAREYTGSHNLKLGRGGLVEILFIVQLLQLEHGRACPSLCAPNTADALLQLRNAGYLTAGEHETLLGAHGFLRRLENGLRLLHDRSLSEFREEPEELGELARHLYRGDRSPADGAQRLLQDFSEHTEAVRRLYRRFFHTQE